MPYKYQLIRIIQYNIKQAVCLSILEARKTFKAVLGVKTHLTYLSFLAGLMVVLMLGTPFLSLAQQQNPSVEKWIAEGEFNAMAQTNRFAWFALGVIGGPITVLVAASQKPHPGEFIGKSPAYVDAFTKGYQAKAKSLRLRYATIGCVTGIAAVTAGYTAYDYQQYGNWWWETW